MRIAVFGLGYVGSVTSVCLAMSGHEVWGVDPHAVKVDWISKGIPPIREPEFAHRLMEVVRSGQLKATTDPHVAVRETDLAMICVGTPTSDDGETNLEFLRHVTADIGQALRKAPHPYLVAVRSTVPAGTTERVVLPALREAAGPAAFEAGLQICFNPEFLREGTAIRDFFDPPFTVVGVEGDPAAADAIVAQMEAAYALTNIVTVRLNFKEAELVKVICNAFHALKIDFANEVGSLAGRLGADPARLMNAFCLDTKLNASPKYLRPGFAFGGSCLPKDVRGLINAARANGLSLPLVEAILPSNHEHLHRAFEAVSALPGRVVGLVGLVFKADTDDVRESAAVALARKLIDAGKDVLVFEPEIDRERLIGANLAFLEERFPEYRKCLVDWPVLAEKADAIVLSRSGIVSNHALESLRQRCLLLTDLTQI